jgi:hypothetical protein
VGIDLSVSTLADQVGAAAFAIMPLYRSIEAHIFAAERLHGDDSTVPILAKSKAITGRFGAMCGIIAPSAVGRPRPQSFTRRRIGAVNIRHGTS